MSEADVVLTGVPRSGTTLTCYLLNKLPDTVALHEPMQGMNRGTNDPRELSLGVKQFFDDQRVSIRARGRALSRNIDGVVPDNPFSDEPSETGARRQIDQKGEAYFLKAKVAGERLDDTRHQQRADVKAVTLHGFSVEKQDSGWKARVLLDI